MKLFTSSLISAATALCLNVAPALADDLPTQNQQMLTLRVTEHSPQMEIYIKDRPILGWRLTSDSLEDIPAPIREALGSVDATGYDAEYLAKNKGSIVALQMRKDGTDFYIIGKETFDSKYELVALDEVAEKNSRLVERLDMAPEVQKMFNQRTTGLVGALKTTPVEMIRVSGLGYDLGKELTIQAPWGTQTKPAKADAFLVWDSGENQYYMVNAGSDGNPSGYIPGR
ncbi:hypothetical protein HW561_21995 [Rhodobacteraceae bacterium B1Z28]|uniref:Uncharacterized protein n=1 Tax=Ruegeria haliotis TaxID=2747601 RepID=A0ABX2PWN8_9RHOB|nr:hypothetical protein [Ruegeria haliotis]NVO58458.1 hypothetical protein [Ruegeria haliotis]